MGEMFSQLGCQKDEIKSILPPNSAIGGKAASYSSIGSSKSFCSCVPCKGAAGANFVTCPTCQGSGEIPRELEKQLVALIPYGDQRLKPRHTKLSVFLAVFICLVTSSSIIFFLFPRSIAVQPAGLNSSTVAFDETDIHLNMTSILNISNTNYYPITVTKLTIEVLHLSLVVGQVSNSLLLHIGPLASEQERLIAAVPVNIYLWGIASPGLSLGLSLLISYWCEGRGVWKFLELRWDNCPWCLGSREQKEGGGRPERTKPPQTAEQGKTCPFPPRHDNKACFLSRGTLTWSHLSHSEQLVFESYEYVDCRGNMSVPHLLIPHPP
ncbi:Transmembrane protein 106A [Sciurus carolinensis]|uniref:Transmembrane protein 106A n=1 Tax=Sciurus carolinensis TaxID=30640 RepID=A0AA41MT06_SCICA|nr:Transmembrane protein 106A [Sciurus carolinensis]